MFFFKLVYGFVVSIELNEFRRCVELNVSNIEINFYC